MRPVRTVGTFLAAAMLALVALGPASAGESKYGGTLVVGLSGGEPDSLDPTVSRGSAIGIYPAFCDRLYILATNHGKLVYAPQLAAGAPAISKDKRSYTIPLRHDVQFNDGTPFDAQAVVTTIQRFITYPGSSRATDYASVDGVSASGKYSVVFHLKAPDSTFLNQNMYMLSPTALSKEGAAFAANPVCAGPFMFDHRVVGDNVTLVKSSYWYARSAIHLDKIVFKPMPDSTAAVAALQAGDLQALDQVTPPLLPAVQHDSSLRVLTAPQLGWRGVIINVGNKNGVLDLPYGSTGSPLASSPLLRQAFEEAIDRATMNKVVFSGLYQASCTPIPPANTAWFALIKVPCTPYDPADAKKLVAKAGVSNPTVHLLTNNTSDFLRAAQFIQAEEAAVGINVVIDTTDSATALARETNGSFDAAIGGLEPGGLEPNTLIAQFFASWGVRNYSGYFNPKMDYVLTNGLKASEIKARAVNYRAAQQLIETERPAVVLWNTTSYAAYGTALKGIELAPNGQLLVSDAQYK
jgi:peptide/nickel transport system substrate-binding protein